MDEGLTEEQLRMLMLQDLSGMSDLRQAFIKANQQKEDNVNDIYN